MNDCQCSLEAGHCDRHRVYKTARWKELCRLREDYFQAWEEGRGPGQVNSPQNRPKARRRRIQISSRRVRAVPTLPDFQTMFCDTPEMPPDDWIATIQRTEDDRRPIRYPATPRNPVQLAAVKAVCQECDQFAGLPDSTSHCCDYLNDANQWCPVWLEKLGFIRTIEEARERVDRFISNTLPVINYWEELVNESSAAYDPSRVSKGPQLLVPAPPLVASRPMDSLVGDCGTNGPGSKPTDIGLREESGRGGLLGDGFDRLAPRSVLAESTDPGQGLDFAVALSRGLVDVDDGAENPRGIVVCAGGEKYLPGCYVLLRLLRHLGCTLPVEVWHLGPEEMPDAWRRRLVPLVGGGGDIRDAFAVARDLDAAYPELRASPAVPLGAHLYGYESKLFALQWSRFAEVLSLDADNLPWRDPTFLFDEPAYLDTGAVFWPDGISALSLPFQPYRETWRAFGIPDDEYRLDDWPHETGQIVIHKRRHWDCLALCNWYAQHGRSFFFHYQLGDKDIPHMAFRKLRREFSMIPHWPLTSTKVRGFFQRDFAGKPLFYHRAGCTKLTLNSDPYSVPDLLHIAVCRKWLCDLAKDLHKHA
jgi:hypothetical protein